jgi:hypothetical protein
MGISPWSRFDDQGKAPMHDIAVTGYVRVNEQSNSTPLESALLVVQAIVA